MPCLPVPHHLLEFVQVYIHCISDVIHSSHLYFPFLLLPSIFSIIRVVSNELILAIPCITPLNLTWLMDIVAQVSCNTVLYSIVFYFYHQIHLQWGLLPLWSNNFILSGLFPSSILNTYHPGRLIFWCHTLLPFYTVHGGSHIKYNGVVCQSFLQWITYSYLWAPCKKINSRWIKNLHLSQ